jgi:hypothetical protein
MEKKKEKKTPKIKKIHKDIFFNLKIIILIQKF